MDKEVKRQSMLEMLNKQFQEKQNEKKKKIWSNRKIQRAAGVVGVALLSGCIIWATVNKPPIESDIVDNPGDVLTEMEMEAWEKTPVNKNEVFFDVNTQWTIEEGGKEIFLRLINPPYSAYPIRVSIYLEDKPDEILYVSEILNPGTIVENAELRKKFGKGIYQVIIKYSFYQQDTEEIFGQHEVGAKLTVE